MSFTLPYIFKNGVKKKREYPRQTPVKSPSISGIGSGVNPGGDTRELSFPTLASMVQSKATPSPSPTSSSSSRSRPTSTSTNPAGTFEPEELEDNRFYRYMRSHFNLIFSRSALVCVPHSKSLEGIVLTKDFVETHAYNPSPYYRGQYQAANGKVIMIEHPIISTVSGYKEPRTTCIVSEELVYIARKKIRVILIERPLEGDPLQQPQTSTTMTVPSVRNSKTDLDFLNMFPENTEAIQELQFTVQKFVDTYVYIRGFNTYTVDKIQSMYIKAYKMILERNKLLRETCRVQAEHDHFLELVENVVMGMLHEKIWVHSLRSILLSQDNFLESICRAYAKESITLSRYAVSHPIAEMPLQCFESAITCLRRVDPEAGTRTSVALDEDRTPKTTELSSDPPALTPLEKLACVRTTLDLISKAVADYVQSLSVGTTDKVDESPVTTDEMIPLLAYILVHSNISRIASLAFYMEYFRLSVMERSDHSFVLVTLKAAIEFLKGDPLALHDTSSEKSTLSATSTSSAILSPKMQTIRTRSTSFGSPVPATSVSAGTLHYRSVSMSSQPVAGMLRPPPTTSPASLSTHLHAPTRLRHRKSHSADLHGVAAMLHQDSSDDKDHYPDEYQPSSTSTGRRNSITPSVVVRPPIVLPSPREMNRRSLDIPDDWMIHGRNQHMLSTSPTTTPTITQHGRHGSIASPKTSPIGHTRPIVSTTFPSISNSSPLPGTIHDSSVDRHDVAGNKTNTKLSTAPVSTSLSPSSPPLSPPVRSMMNMHCEPSDRLSSVYDTRKLARSLSSRSSQYGNKPNCPPEVINIRDGTRRPASICIDPRSMYRDDDDDGDDLGDFLRGLQSFHGDIIGERTGSYRTVRRL